MPDSRPADCFVRLHPLTQVVELSRVEHLAGGAEDLAPFLFDVVLDVARRSGPGIQRTSSSNRWSSSTAGSSHRPVCTSDGWITVLDGATSQ